MALIHAGLGEHERAIDLLFASCEEPSLNLLFLKVSPVFDSLRSNPRFGDLLHRAKLDAAA